MSDYTPTGAPADQTRGASATIRSEFQTVATAIATKSDTAGEIYSGTHDFTGGAVIVATQASSDTSTKSASTEFVQNVVLMAGIDPIAHQIATQVEMENGTEAALRLMSPLRVKQAIDASVDASVDALVDALATEFVAYDDRANLRSDTSHDYVMVEAIGLLRHYVGSTEIDDDETCFATATGRWLLECPHWDLVEALQSTEDDQRNNDIEDAEADIATAQADIATAQADIADLDGRWSGRVRRATQACSITSIATLTQTSFTATVTGAAVGDRVVATPPDALDARISVFARVTAANTATIYLNNPSASTATLATGTWSIAVISAT